MGGEVIPLSLETLEVNGSAKGPKLGRVGRAGRLNVLLVVVVVVMEEMPLNPGTGHATEAGGVDCGDVDRDQLRVIAGSARPPLPPPPTPPATMFAMAVAMAEAGMTLN